MGGEKDDVWAGTPNKPLDPNGRAKFPLPDASDGPVMQQDANDSEAMKFATMYAGTVLVRMRKYFRGTVVTRPHLSLHYLKVVPGDSDFMVASFTHWNKLWMQFFVWVSIIYFVWVFFAVVAERPLQILFLPVSTFIKLSIAFVTGFYAWTYLAERPHSIKCKCVIFILWVSTIGVTLPYCFPATNCRIDPHWLWILTMTVPTVYVLVTMWCLGAGAGFKETCPNWTCSKRDFAKDEENKSRHEMLQEKPKAGACQIEPDAGTFPSSCHSEMAQKNNSNRV